MGVVWSGEWSGRRREDAQRSVRVCGERQMRQMCGEVWCDQ